MPKVTTMHEGKTAEIFYDQASETAELTLADDFGYIENAKIDLDPVDLDFLAIHFHAIAQQIRARKL